MNLPTDIAARALDIIGSDFVIGDIEEGSREAQVLLRAYQNCVMQLLRAANWAFARKTAPMTLLGDATGNTPNVGTAVVPPWTYEYAYPTDCMKARFVPWNPVGQNVPVPPGNITAPSGPSVPLMTGLGQPPFNWIGNRPARFLVATDFNYPPPAGQQTWEVQGVSPQGRTVILTNVQNAQLVYTALVLYPSVWDPLFRAAMESYLASEVAMALVADKRMAMEVRDKQIAITKEKLRDARVIDGNEGVTSVSFEASWMRRRNSGGYGTYGPFGGCDDGPGVWGLSWDSCGFADGSCY